MVCPLLSPLLKAIDELLTQSVASSNSKQVLDRQVEKPTRDANQTQRDVSSISNAVPVRMVETPTGTAELTPRVGSPNTVREVETPTLTADQTPRVGSPISNGVQVVETSTIDNFLKELEKEKPVKFTPQQLIEFTNNYSKRLGSGGFGVVFEGEFPHGVKVAVKILNRSLDRKIQNQFMAEAGTIGRTYHINLVRLYGFCYEPSVTALVYEYMENGSLGKHLFSENQDIEWEKLHDIAVGTAKGIAYLHEGCQQRIIHYDIKPENVLLDANFIPKVADFGFAKLCNRDNTHDSVSGHRGTFGYSAPELYYKNFPITHNCDVYSFGMLVFEIVRRRRNSNVESSDSLDWFPKHVWDKYEKNELAEMLVVCGIEEANREKALRMCMVALWCVQYNPKERPLMSAVVTMLEGEVDIEPPPDPFSYLYSKGKGVVKLKSVTSNSSRTSTGRETDTDSGNSESLPETESSLSNQKATPIMSKYEIQFASSEK
ncbi:Kinase [Quillaja saponaria]|uniref:Kinase n=1 Tax=Quillaja saponaria TaxID=32244 RepID=A0AAD7PTA4_QUISA|nr:Kinase [Quillaja saponaria]